MFSLLCFKKGKSMNLAEIRQNFIELTGRYDLEDSKKADMFINAGVRTLDRKANLEHTQNSVWYSLIRSAEWKIEVPNCYRVHRILAKDVQGEGYWNLVGRTEFSEVRRGGGPQSNEGFFHTGFAQQFFHGVRRGKPTHYRVLTTRNEKQLEKLETYQMNVPANYVNSAELAGWILSVELFPRPDTDFVMEVYGKFHSPKLLEEGDTNLWSQLYPDLLIKAACHSLEVFYRNTEGARDWLTDIMDELRDMEQMEVSTDIVDKGVMRG